MAKTLLKIKTFIILLNFYSLGYLYLIMLSLSRKLKFYKKRLSVSNQSCFLELRRFFIFTELLQPGAILNNYKRSDNQYLHQLCRNCLPEVFCNKNVLKIFLNSQGNTSPNKCFFLWAVKHWSLMS